MNTEQRVEKKADRDDDVFETELHDPYNSLNREITESEVNTLLREYGIPTPLHNLKLYQRAFIHKSYVRKPGNTFTKPDDCPMELKSKSNDRLEFVGDGVLECITKYYLYTRFPKADEGFMTDTKIALVKNDALGQLILDMGLEKWYVLSKHAEVKNTRKNVKKLGNLFEAFLGALFLDFNKISVKDEDGWFSNTFLCGPGFQMAQIFVTKIFDKHVNWSSILENNDNYKNQLQVLIQKEFKCVPQYIEMPYLRHPLRGAEPSMTPSASSLPDSGFCMGVYLCLGQSIHHLRFEEAVPFKQYGNFHNIHQEMSLKRRVFILLGQGQHKIKKKAEQMACSMALQVITTMT